MFYKAQGKERKEKVHTKRPHVRVPIQSAFLDSGHNTEWMFSVVMALGMVKHQVLKTALFLFLDPLQTIQLLHISEMNKFSGKVSEFMRKK